MKEFLTNLNSIYWWISVVIVGLALNIFSSYFRDIIDKVFSRFSGWWANRSKIRKAKIQEAADAIVGDKLAQIEMQLAELRAQLLAGIYILFCFLLIIFWATLDSNKFFNEAGYLGKYMYFTIVIMLISALIILIVSTSKSATLNQILRQCKLAESKIKKGSISSQTTS